MDDWDAWLAEQPLDTIVEIADENICLKRHDGGAVLAAYLFEDYLPAQLHTALALGFSSCMEFDAGLGVSDDGKSLVLSVWLAGVDCWSDAADALENLLNQLASWREMLAPSAALTKPSGVNRNESRLRALFAKR